MKYVIFVVLLLFTSFVLSDTLDYQIKDGKFFTAEGRIPDRCFGQLMTELNGDNSIAAIFVNRNSFRGCIAANYPYPGGADAEISYVIEEHLSSHVYRLKICQEIDGSIGASCDKILVKFVNREYLVSEQTIQVLSLEKIGEW